MGTALSALLPEKLQSQGTFPAAGMASAPHSGFSSFVWLLLQGQCSFLRALPAVPPALFSPDAVN